MRYDLYLKLLAMTNKQGKLTVKCLSQGHNRMKQIGLKPRPCQSQFSALNHSNHTADI